MAELCVHNERSLKIVQVWNNHHSRERVQLNVQKSLKKLQLSYADLVLVHWPTAFQVSGTMFIKVAGQSPAMPRLERGARIVQWFAERQARDRKVASVFESQH